MAEGLGVGDEVGGHCCLGLGLLQAPFQLRDLKLAKGEKGGMGTTAGMALVPRAGTEARKRNKG